MRAHTVEDMRVQLEARTEWSDTLADQNGVELLRSLFALHHQQDDTRPGMMEVTNQDRHLYLCTQKEHQNNTEYIKAFQNAIDAINDSGGMPGATIRGLNLVCQEQSIDYAALPAEIEVNGTMVPNPKKTALSNEAQERYRAALAASGLSSKRHGWLNMNIANKWVTERIDILPKNFVKLHKITKGYVDDEVPRGKPRYDPNQAGVALVDTGERKPRGGRNGTAQADMTGIRNKAGKSGCNH